MISTLVLETKDEKAIQKEILLRVRPKSFFGLAGDMGAGKTTLIADLLKDQKVHVTSPTFALHNSYWAFGLDILHVDLYRLTTAEEIESAGFWDLFANKDSVIFTEWVERIDMQDIPFDWNSWLITINPSENQVRTYSLYQFTK